MKYKFKGINEALTMIRYIILQYSITHGQSWSMVCYGSIPYTPC